MKAKELRCSSLTETGPDRKMSNNSRGSGRQPCPVTHDGFMLSESKKEFFQGKTQELFRGQTLQLESDESLEEFLKLHDIGMNYVQNEFRILLNLFLPFGLSPLTFENDPVNADDKDVQTKTIRGGKFEWRWRSQRTYMAFFFSILSVLLTLLYKDMEKHPEHWIKVYPATSNAPSPKTSVSPFSHENNDDNKTNQKEPISWELKPWKDVIVNHDLEFLIEFSSFLLPLAWLIDVSCGWLKAKELGIYLNNWSIFQDKFNKYFASLGKSPTSIAVRVYKGITRPVGLGLCGREKYFVRRVHFWTTTIITTLSLITLVIFVTGNFLTLKPMAWIATHAVLGCRLTLLGLLVDARDYFMYNHVIEAFRMIRLSIREFKGTNSNELPLPSPLTCATVVQWHDLIKMVRRQCHLLCKYQKPTQLFYLLRLIISETLILFIITSIRYSRATPTHLLTWAFALGVFFICLLCQLYVKCVKAEQITIEEAKLIEELSVVVICPSDPTTVETIRFLCMSTLRTPSCVNMGNYFVLNRKLLLIVIAQVIVYLIVLKQFNNF